jgi:peptidyl-prolyl cis-trans isomerase D
MPLKNVSKQIEDKLRSKEAETLAGERASALNAKLQAGSNPDTVLSSYSLSWSTAGFLGRYSTKVDSAILDLAFRMPHPQANKPVYGVTRLPNGYAIVRLNAVKDGAVADKKQYAIFADQVQNSQGVLDYELYKQSQITNAKVKMQ